MIQRFVLDCSLAMSWCFQNEQSAATERLLDDFTRGTTALVPVLWVWEVNNVLITAQRERRIDAAKRHQQMSLLRRLPITVDEQGYQHAWSDTANLALAHNLTAYDASYLELALREGLPLASLDRDLRKAAQKAGAKCLPEKL
jgi:predicted nucleic acid-binding protein